jgi:hypothetical protein
MRPWYMDAEPAAYGDTGFGALPAAYGQAISTLQPLATIADASQAQSAYVPGQVAYMIDTLSQLVSQFSSGDAQTVQSNPAYQTLLAQEQAVIANGDYTTSPQHATTNFYTSKGNYSYPAIGQAAAALMPVLQGLTGAVAPPSFNPTPNSTFVPVPTVTSRASSGVRAVGPAPLVAAPLVSSGGLVPIPAGTTPPSSATSSPAYNPATGVITNNPPPLGTLDPNNPATGGMTPSGMIPTPAGYPTPMGPVPTAVNTDPSTGVTTTYTTNPDGSTTATSSGPGTEPTTVTIPPPPVVIFIPETREGRNHFVMALALGVLGAGALALLASSTEGKKIVTEVAKPIDAVVTPVTNVVGDAVDAVFPEGPTENPIRRKRKPVRVRAPKVRPRRRRLMTAYAQGKHEGYEDRINGRPRLKFLRGGDPTYNKGYAAGYGKGRRR